MKCAYFGSGVGMGLPIAPYLASMSRRICAIGIPAWYLSITSRVMSVQIPQVAA